MKKIVFVACALLIGSFAAQAQEDSDMVGTTTTKKVVQKETAPVVKTTDAPDPGSDAVIGKDTKAPQGMDKILEERKERAAAIRAAKKEENQKRLANKKTGVTKSKAKVVTKEMLEAEKIEKQKKATKKDN